MEVPNRDLLMERCMTHSRAVANMFCPTPPEAKATFHEPGTPPMSPISENGFNMLDLVLVPQDSLHMVAQVQSDRLVPVASHHFPVVASLNISLDKSFQL